MAHGQGSGAARLLACGHQRLFHCIAPAAQQRLQPGIHCARIDFPRDAAGIEDIAQHGQTAAFHAERPVERGGAGCLFQQPLDAQAGGSGQHVARQPDEGEHVAAQRGGDQGCARTRPVDQGHHGGGHAQHVGLREPDHQIVRQHRQCVHQRPFIMAAGDEGELRGDGRQARAQHGHQRRRRGQRGTGPDAGVRVQRHHFVILHHGRDEQVQRHPAMDAAEAVGLDDQRGGFLLAPGPCEMGEGAGPAVIRQQVTRTLAAQAQRAGVRSVPAAHHVAQLGQHAACQPGQQGTPFAVAQPRGVLRQRLLHLRPVGHGGADIGQGGGQLRLQRAALPGIDAVGLQVDQALRDRSVAQRGQGAIRLAGNGHDRVHQQVHGQALGGNGMADRIDQEGHVAVDHGHLRHAPAGLGAIAGGGDQDRAGSLGPVLRCVQQECRHLVQRSACQRLLARQDRIGNPPGQLRQRLRLGHHRPFSPAVLSRGQ